MRPNTDLRIVVMRATFAGDNPTEDITVTSNVTMRYNLFGLLIGLERVCYVRDMAVHAYVQAMELYPDLGYGLAPWVIEFFDRDRIATYFVDNDTTRVECASYTKYRGCHDDKVTTERLEIYDAMLAEYMALRTEA